MKRESSMINRRRFIKESTFLGLGISFMPLNLLGRGEESKLVILHTNDWHSRIEPFPMDGGKFQGLGGAAKRAELIKKIREEEEHVLLFDSGDIFQGTPYFNVFGGELEFKLMSEMGYDAATLGNHDFDAGLSGLKDKLHFANFPFVCSNYDFSETELKGAFPAHIILNKSDLKIGVFGLGVELKGLVPESQFGATKYSEPIQAGKKISRWLKLEKKCDLVICLSHLGYKYPDTRASDIRLAEESEFIDIILGGHTHTFLETPTLIRNRQDRTVIVNHAGWGGILLGRLDFIGTKLGRLKQSHDAMVKVS